MIRIVKKRRSYFAVSILLLAASIALSQEVQTGNNPQSVRPLQMLVLGDSLLWGQGLKPAHKTWHYVKVWLEKSTGRQVVEKIEAHSGAVIEHGPLTDHLTSSNNEVNLGLPSINDQLDDAVRFYSDPATVDLVLVSGCGNDVGVQNLLDAASTSEVDDMTKAKCGQPVEKLLRRITTAFPNAQVILTGYYPFFSEQTKNDFILKRLARRFFKSQTVNNARVGSKEVFELLKVNSRQWHQASNATLAEAVYRVNAELGRQRVVFASVEFPAPYSFGAPQTHLWGFNRSPFRMALLLLSFGKILLPANDDVRKQRTASCNELYKKERDETADQKRNRKALRLYCRYASLGHPNRKGAQLYADSITRVLKSNWLAGSSIQ